MRLGPLRISVSTSVPQVEAGKDFSVFVQITNPYDVPVAIRRTGTRLPVDFYDPDTRVRQKQREELAGRVRSLMSLAVRERLPELTQAEKRRRQQLREVVKDLARLIPFGSSISAAYSIAEYARASTVAPTERVIREVEDVVDSGEIEALVEKAIASEDPATALKGASVELLERQMEQLGVQEEAVLQPGDSTVQAFTLRSRRSLLFAPSTFNLHIQVEYEVQANVHHDSVDFQFSARASLKSIIIGAALGGVVGFLLRDIFAEKGLVAILSNPSAGGALEWSVKLVGNLLLGFTIAIAFARKKDAQPILAIEDFWGGLFVGAAAAYAGKSLLDQFLLNEAPAGGGA